MRSCLCLLTLLALLAARAAAAPRVDDVRGAVGARRFEGRVTLEDGPDGVRVSLEVRFQDGARASWSGPGARAGDLVTASVRPTLGAAQLLGGADRAGAAQTLTHELLDGGRSWRVRLGALEGTGRAGRERVATTGTKDTAGELQVDRWQRLEGVPFVRGEGDPRAVHESDPTQGVLGDCWLIAGLAAVARARPEKILQMIQPGALAGEWTVRLHARRYLVLRREVDVAVDGRLPVDKAGAPVFARLGDTMARGGKLLHELWPALVERALAQERGGYGELEGGHASEVFSLCGLEGDQRPAAPLSAAAIDELLRDALARGQPLCLGFPKDVGALERGAGIVGSHAYVVVRAEGGGYRLLNPWQSSHPSRVVTAEELRQVGASIHIGREPAR